MDWKRRHTVATAILALLYSLPYLSGGWGYWAGSLAGGIVVWGVIVYVVGAGAQRLLGEKDDTDGDPPTAEPAD